ncbi:MAG TPA: gephyrin-like molybdotransferase Glp [Thermoanaerobaculia bacterium]|nr:gephyrin-like molybdotransferase Glp [Thermoanaerobaculia bacterium]
MISPDALWSLIAARCRPGPVVASARREALGRFLAEPVRARCDLPPVDVSALDGYALAGEVAAGAELPVAGTVAAGDPPTARLAPGAAWRIWTGAPVPAGADRVVAIERTEPVAGERVRVLESPKAAAAIRRRGEVVRTGDSLLETGTLLGPSALALAASQGVEELAVFRPPRVAVLATGDEVVPASAEPLPGGLRDSHSDYLLAAGRALGLELEPLGIAPDDPVELAARLGPALERCDVVVTCGGVSMGGEDHLPGVLRALGCRIEAHGVAVQPGKPLLFGSRGEVLVFGLPGNPASVMVGFRLFVRPALRRLLGSPGAAFWDEAFEVVTEAHLRAGGGRDRFLPALALPWAGPPRARPLSARGSHDLAAFARADLLLRVRAEDPAAEPGARVEAIDWT